MGPPLRYRRRVDSELGLLRVEKPWATRFEYHAVLADEAAALRALLQILQSVPRHVGYADGRSVPRVVVLSTNARRCAKRPGAESPGRACRNRARLRGSISR